MVSWEQLLLEKNAVFYCKGETMTEMLMVPGEDFGRHEMEQWKAVLFTCRSGDGALLSAGESWAQGINRPQGYSPAGGLASAADRGLLQALCRACAWAVLPPVLAGGTCQATEGWASVLERCNVLHPQGKLAPGSCSVVHRYGISEL